MATVNIVVENDADFYSIFQYVTTNPDGTIGAPVDMTGCSLEMMLRAVATDVTALLRLGSDTGDFVLMDQINGYFSLYVAQAVLVALPLGTYDQSNIMTLGGLKTRIWSGSFVISAGATR